MFLSLCKYYSGSHHHKTLKEDDALTASSGSCGNPPPHSHKIGPAPIPIPIPTEPTTTTTTTTTAAKPQGRRSWTTAKKETRKARQQVLRQQLLLLLRQHSSENNDDNDNDCGGKRLLMQIQALIKECPAILKRPLTEAENDDDQQHQPSSSSYYSSSCGLMLHVALKHQAPLSIIRYLVRKYPESLHYKDVSNNKMVALHYATLYQATLPVVQFLVQSWPHAMSATTLMEGQLPLHLACQHACATRTKGVVEYLVQQRPSLITSRNPKHGQWLPLHYAAANPHTSLETIQCLVETARPTHVVTVDKRSSSGRCPLHLACWNAATLPVVQYLVECFPKALQLVDYKHALPLHLACGGNWRNGRRAQLDVVTCLLQAWPDAIRAKTRNYRLPLHECCLHLAPLEVVQYVYALFPEAVHCKTREGKTPLDEALAPRYGEVEPLADVVEFLRLVTAHQRDVNTMQAE